MDQIRNAVDNAFVQHPIDYSTKLVIEDEIADMPGEVREKKLVPDACRCPEHAIRKILIRSTIRVFYDLFVAKEDIIIDMVADKFGQKISDGFTIETGDIIPQLPNRIYHISESSYDAIITPYYLSIDMLALLHHEYGEKIGKAI